MSERHEALLESLFEGRDSPVSRDLKLNLKRVASQGALPPEEAALALIAAGTALKHRGLTEVAVALAREAGLTDGAVHEAQEAAAIAGMLNIYYRFRHMIESQQGKDAVDASYRTAGLRMNALAKPALGKERFEMLAFAVSVLNGCEYCVNAHEQELKQLGTPADKLHDLARLAAVALGVATLLT